VREKPEGGFTALWGQDLEKKQQLSIMKRAGESCQPGLQCGGRRPSPQSDKPPILRDKGRGMRPPALQGLGFYRTSPPSQQRQRQPEKWASEGKQ